MPRKTVKMQYVIYAEQCDVVLVVGSPNSSNSNRLRELAERMGKHAYLVDNADQLQQDWFNEHTKIGVTAGASAPEILIKQVIQRLQDWGQKRRKNWMVVKKILHLVCQKSYVFL